jgi:hypothetical protein
LTNRCLAAVNRRNARQSTGPRTAEGKRSVARNALRHGLTVPVPSDPVLAKEIVELAERIANGSTDSRMRELAVNVAAAQVDVQRVRHARHVLVARPAIGAGEIRQLCALDRYERLAMWRRKLATLAWQAALFGSTRSAQ